MCFYFPFFLWSFLKKSVQFFIFLVMSILRCFFSIVEKMWIEIYRYGLTPIIDRSDNKDLLCLITFDHNVSLQVHCEIQFQIFSSGKNGNLTNLSKIMAEFCRKLKSFLKNTIAVWKFFLKAVFKREGLCQVCHGKFTDLQKV